MLHFGLIGERLGHSLSVPIHQAIWQHLGIDADYRLIEIPKDRLADRVDVLLNELDGFNITIPYKQAVIPLLSSMDPMAEKMGAVNTVCCAERIGYNTDAPGFAEMLRYHSIDPMGRPCYVLGTGGASKAVRAALEGLGASRITMVSRNPGEDTIGYEQLQREFEGILVNTTPAGMWPDTEKCPVNPSVLSELLKRAAGVADVIYNPTETVLTHAAKAAGVPACTGLYMLIAQAVQAERIWMKCDIPQEMSAILMKELKLL